MYIFKAYTSKSNWSILIRYFDGELSYHEKPCRREHSSGYYGDPIFAYRDPVYPSVAKISFNRCMTSGRHMAYKIVSVRICIFQSITTLSLMNYFNGWLPLVTWSKVLYGSSNNKMYCYVTTEILLKVVLKRIQFCHVNC
jgi:hypothetical protein